MWSTVRFYGAIVVFDCFLVGSTFRDPVWGLKRPEDSGIAIEFSFNPQSLGPPGFHPEENHKKIAKSSEPRLQPPPSTLHNQPFPKRFHKDIDSDLSAKPTNHLDTFGDVAGATDNDIYDSRNAENVHKNVDGVEVQPEAPENDRSETYANIYGYESSFDESSFEDNYETEPNIEGGASHPGARPSKPGTNPDIDNGENLQPTDAEIYAINEDDLTGSTPTDYIEYEFPSSEHYIDSESTEPGDFRNTEKSETEAYINYASPSFQPELSYLTTISSITEPGQNLAPFDQVKPPPTDEHESVTEPALAPGSRPNTESSVNNYWEKEEDYWVSRSFGVTQPAESESEIQSVPYDSESDNEQPESDLEKLVERLGEPESPENKYPINEVRPLPREDRFGSEATPYPNPRTYGNVESSQENKKGHGNYEAPETGSLGSYGNVPSSQASSREYNASSWGMSENAAYGKHPSHTAPVSSTKFDVNKFRAAFFFNGTCTSGDDCHDHCCFWAKIGECRTNAYWMRPMCQKSCGTSGCKVEHADDCPIDINVLGCPWAEAIEEIELPTSKLTQQNASGRIQEVCANTSPVCNYWKSIGECEKNPWMPRGCRKSCGLC